MPDNSKYPLGLDFYEGNSIRSFPPLDALGVKFAYFRLGSGMHKDDLSLLTDAMHTSWRLGGYYVLWLPSLPVQDMIDTLRAQLSTPAGQELTLPLALDFEPITTTDQHGRKITGWPSVGDLKTLMEAFPDTLVYTNLAGLEEIQRVLSSIPITWSFWIARYPEPQVGEVDVEATLALLETQYNIHRSRVLFMQTSQNMPMPPGASFDKGLDYDRAVFYDLGSVPAPAPEPMPEPLPTPQPLGSYVVKAPSGLNVRAAPMADSEILGGIMDRSTVYGRPVDAHWLELAGFVSRDFLVSPQPGPAQEAGLNLYRVLHDFELPPEYLPRMLQRGSVLSSSHGAPEVVVVVVEGAGRTPIDKRLQLVIYDLLRTSAPPDMAEEEIKHAFRAVLGSHLAFCNESGFDDLPRADFISGRDLSAPLPYFDKVRTCGGNVVNVIEEYVKVAGVGMCHKIETLKTDDLPNNLEAWQMVIATIAVPYELPGGRYKVTPFPQLDGADVRLPLVTVDGFGYIPVERLIKTDRIPSPYVW